MKTLLTALLAGLLVASVHAQTALDRKPNGQGIGQSENMFQRRAREAAEAQKQAATATSAQQDAAFVKLRTQMQEKGIRTVCGTVLSVVKPGELFLVSCRSGTRGDVYSYLTGERLAVPPIALPTSLDEVVILLRSAPGMGELVDRDRIQVLAGATGGTYEYTTALGAKSTVRVYSAVMTMPK